MIRIVFVALLWVFSAFVTVASDLTALARLDPAESYVRAGWGGGVKVQLALSQGVPFRIVQLADPYRLLVDFQEVDFGGVAFGDSRSAPLFVYFLGGSCLRS